MACLLSHDMVVIIIKMVENRKEGGERSDICHHITYHHEEDNYNQHLVPSFIHGLGFENQKTHIGRKKVKKKKRKKREGVLDIKKLGRIF
jgi:hypothetical protein